MRPIWSYRGPNPLSRFLERQAWNAHIERVKVEIARDTGKDLEPNPFAKIGDKKRLRGIPVSGFGGTIDGTDPALEVERREEKAERDREYEVGRDWF